MARDWVLGIAAAFAMIGALRIGFLVLFRRPAAARICSTNLDEGERLQERDMHLAALFDGKPSADDLHYRGVDARVAFMVRDVEYRADVSLIVHVGDRPDSTLLIWYDPRNPTRATAIGIGPAALLLLMAGTLVVAGWQLPF